MKVNITKLNSEAVIPKRANENDAGCDLVAISKTRNYHHDYIEYDTGISIEIPVGYVGLIYPRSSISKYDLSLCNSVGVIDPGYTGSIKLRFTPNKKADIITQLKYYNIGDKVGQLVIIKNETLEFNVCNELEESERGEGGFGSSDE